MAVKNDSSRPFVRSGDDTGPNVRRVHKGCGSGIAALKRKGNLM